jgi:hypothetical protein
MTFRYSELKLKATIMKEFGYKKQPKFPVYHKMFERDGLYISQSMSVHDILHLKVLTPILADLDFKNRNKLKNAVRA